MRTDRDLEDELARIDRRGYPAYKDLRGSYAFEGFDLAVEHVQGDPFAAPSLLSVHVPERVAGWPRDLSDAPHRRVALEDFLVRRLSRALARRSHEVGGSGKSGLMATVRPGPEVLSRSACEVGGGGVTARFEVGFPAHGRSCDARALARILLDLVPACVDEALVADEASLAVAARAVELADDQHFVRAELKRLGLVAFVADGSVLPRESGVSSRPMAGAVPFRSPGSLRVTLDLPHRGPTSGMAVRRGVTLVVGGGYHGKSTLLKALQEGVYDHVAGDGRELVITDDTAVKLRAEVGRAVAGVDISLFIGELPSGQDTRRFSTLDASGSTSQAAGTVEALAAGARALLIDEDTSATNFMVRDRLMEAVVSREHEPITPFVERVRDLWERAGVSSVIVAGSSGAFFSVADVVLQMDRYEAHDITDRARETCERLGAPATPSAPGFETPRESGTVRVDAREERPARGGRGRAPREPKAKAFGTDEVQLGRGGANLRLVEQLVDGAQVAALAQLVRLAWREGLLEGRLSAREVCERVYDELGRDGWQALGGPGVGCGLALPRPQELAATLRRWRN